MDRGREASAPSSLPPNVTWRRNHKKFALVARCMRAQRKKQCLPSSLPPTFCLCSRVTRVLARVSISFFSVGHNDRTEKSISRLPQRAVYSFHSCSIDVVRHASFPTPSLFRAYINSSALGWQAIDDTPVAAVAPNCLYIIFYRNSVKEAARAIGHPWRIPR